MKKTISVSLLALAALVAVSSCDRHEIDNEKSNYNAIMEMSTSSDVVILDESKPDEVALTITWTPAYDYGDDFVMTYKYQYEVTTSTVSAVSEYEDSDMFVREYTNSELQKILTGRFGQLTSSYANLKFTVSCTYAGPKLVIPDESSVTVRVKTYGPKQFKADRVYLDGSAVPAGKTELEPSAKNADLYVYEGKLFAGKLFFPVDYGDESNAVVPADASEQAITGDAMNATVKDAKDGGAWLIPEEDNYRVTLNFSSKTVSVLRSDDILELDSLMLTGTAVGTEAIKLEATRENSSLYAFRSELKAGTLYIPVMYEDASNICIVPSDAASHDINDGQATPFGQALSSTSGSRYWTIPADGTYRIIVDTEAKSITIYSSATDLKNSTVSYNNTVYGINPYVQEVTELYMWGTFSNLATSDDYKNEFSGNSKASVTGFHSDYTLKQSLANPNLFVYAGKALPRNTAKDTNGTTQTVTGSVKFCVWYGNNNVYCYGTTNAAAKRNSQSTFDEVALGAVTAVKGGQSDNRYAYFLIPEGCNYIELDIQNLTVLFDKR